MRRIETGVNIVRGTGIMACRRGSITVETSLVLPFFIFSVLAFISVIRLICASIALDHAVSETAKQLAESCYPISFINEFEDEKLGQYIDRKIPSYDEELKNIAAYAREKGQDMLSSILSGKADASVAKAAFESIARDAAGDFGKGIIGEFCRKYAGDYFTFKSGLKYSAAAYLISVFCRGSPVDASAVRLAFVELPRGGIEFAEREKDAEYVSAYGKFGIKPGKDDVVVAAEYPFEVALPFVPPVRAVMCRVAVERAWINGSNGVYGDMEMQAAGTEGGNAGSGDVNGDAAGRNDGGENDAIVYITRTGTRYHADGCNYLKKSRIPIKLGEAKNRGYIPCRVCILKTAEPIGK